MEATKIRMARPEDLAGIEAIFRSHRRDYDWRYAERYFRAHFEGPEPRARRRLLVGVADGRVVGVIEYVQDGYETDDVYWLGWFDVHEDARGERHGRRLVERVVRELRKRGARKLYADTSSLGSYRRARRKYKEYGFVEEARLKDYYEEGEDQVIFGMTLT